MRKCLPLMLILIVLFFFSTAHGEWNNFRDYEAVVITGQLLTQFQSQPIDHIFIFSYNYDENTWHQITHQVDEKDGGADYFITPNFILDANDEILFMAKDAGDRSPLTQWIDDEDSRQYVRYEIEIADPYVSGISKYVYIYFSTTLSTDSSLPIYMNYIPRSSGYSDTVRAAGFIEGHNKRGVPDTWIIPDSAGGNGTDFLDRQKARVKGKYRKSFFSYSFELNEDDLEGDGDIKVKTGPVRTIREIKYKTDFLGLMTVTVGTFKYHYYPHQIVAFGTNKTLGSDYGIKLIRQSFDLNVNAEGMLFNDSTNFNVTIDGVVDTVVKAIYPTPLVNWYMFSGQPGTVVMINEFEPLINANSKFYYRDNLNGGSNDGTGDTGDGKCYGDAGILFEGSKIQGKFSIPYVSYFLPANQPRDVGQTIVEQYKNPLMKTSASQIYTPPAEIAISIPDTSAPQQMPIDIPVRIDDLQGQEIRRCQFAIAFDPNVIEVTGISIQNSLVENWYQPIVIIETDSIYISLEGLTPLHDAGVLFFLTCFATGTPGQQSPLEFTYAKFNNGDPIAVAVNGMFTTLPPLEVEVTLSDTTVITGNSITIPVQVGDLTGLNVTSCYMEIQYSKFVLDAVSAHVDSSIASQWTTLSIDRNIGLITLSLQGEHPLVGSGELIWIVFDVIGSPGDVSDLMFKQMRFNDGVPLAVPQNGRLTVVTSPPKEVFVTIPDTISQTGASIQLPITISDITGMKINKYHADILFNETVLNFQGVNRVGTISSQWGEPVVNVSSGKISIFAYGTTSLEGSGVLIYLSFKVLGIDGSSTTLSFDNMNFYSSSINASTRSGTVSVQGAVPVELASFIAVYENNAVTLQWSTVSETNNYGFYIQRRMSEALIWETIGFVRGAGTTSSPQSYQFIDKEGEPGKWTYRLMQQDMDGSVNYSASVEVEVLAVDKFTLKQNYPNPFNARTTIVYELPRGEHKINLVIYNLLGEPVRRLVSNEIQRAGIHQVIWDGKDEWGNEVNSGIYYYQLQAGRNKVSKKMVVIE